MSSDKYFACPHCGEDVKESAVACKSCGSDNLTGWSDTPDDTSFLPPDDDDYEENLAREFGIGKKKKLMPNWVAITGFVLVLLWLLAYLR
ncbi:MAG: hypothetical protein HQK83_09510 [Fibrobacteria bacterium]|nr:hypothetical protein [Fibrobacteria bacterium]